MRPSLVLVSDSSVSIEIECAGSASSGTRNRILIAPPDFSLSTIHS